ncbi:SIS domain-containing protein [Oceanivirga miroungae]|uniref:D-galactosamine-6-phosphate deaminase AgaS n=1 Tax=Oceanivirga miroungae TaxID=1130046 RepID=A0A6I8MBQ2_9FUSO|nr:SIS domain-containing protein [Oceanivirga miroungae]VWL85667.1 D-galactosamine-6-phosphate deaminase AgaS [Oceanivirga miroungae]
MKILGIDENVLKETNSYDTANEICSQPGKWRKLVEGFNGKEKEIRAYFSEIGLSKDWDIIFTGAGTSEYVGNILEPLLNSKGEYRFRSVATTDLVNNPEMYLQKDKKTLLISFARSGNSPESVASVELLNQLVKDAYHLFITCNEEGELAKRSKVEKNTFLYLMPEGTNDKSFAMTSSFSSMVLAGILLFYEKDEKTLLEAIKVSEEELEAKYELIKDLANKEHERIIVLGSGPLKGLSQELCLKVLELTAGKVVAKYDSTLGFRHGPKAIVNNKTIVFLCNSVDEYASKYDLGLYSEMFEEEMANMIVSYSINPEKISKVSNLTISPSRKVLVNDITAILTYLVYGQMYAFFKSQHFGLTTDNPFPTGEVNRVVKKFEIHKYTK